MNFERTTALLRKTVACLLKGVERGQNEEILRYTDLLSKILYEILI